MTLIPKGTKPHYAIFPQTISFIRTHPTERCVVLSFLIKKNIVNDEIVFRKNGVVGFIALRYLCHKHIFWHFYLKLWARKIALKTSKNAINSSKFEHQKLQITCWKNCVLSHLYPKAKKKHNAIFPEKIFRKWRLTLVYKGWKIRCTKNQTSIVKTVACNQEKLSGVASPRCGRGLMPVDRACRWQRACPREGPRNSCWFGQI